LTEIEDYVAREVPVNIYVDRKHLATIFTSPQLLKELAVGHLIAEGIIDSVDDISQITMKGNNILITLKYANVDLESLKSFKLVTTECTTIENYVDSIKTMFNLSVDSEIRVRASRIFEMVRRINELARVYKRTGGTHVAALFNENAELLFIVEDIGRHNAIDKVIGLALLNGYDTSKTVMVSSGRISAGIVFKAARAKIPIIVSISAPLDSGLIAADKIGITLICFVRGKRMNIYTHVRRILLDQIK